jgi:hypothetical protein
MFNVYGIHAYAVCSVCMRWCVGVKEKKIRGRGGGCVVTTVVGVFLGMFRQLLVAWSGGRPRWWPGLLVVVVCLVVVLVSSRRASWWLLRCWCLLVSLWLGVFCLGGGRWQGCCLAVAACFCYLCTYVLGGCVSHGQESVNCTAYNLYGHAGGPILVAVCDGV